LIFCCKSVKRVLINTFPITKEGIEMKRYNATEVNNIHES
jgi:hypothetical protein